LTWESQHLMGLLKPGLTITAGALIKRDSTPPTKLVWLQGLGKLSSYVVKIVPALLSG
jgi:hypothetical protein